MADPVALLQFVSLFCGLFWATLFLMPLKAAHYASDGRLVVRRIFLGTMLAGLAMRRVRRNGPNLVLDLNGQAAIVGGPAVSASLVGVLVSPWVA